MNEQKALKDFSDQELLNARSEIMANLMQMQLQAINEELAKRVEAKKESPIKQESDS